MILYLYGPDTYRSREYLRHSINQFKNQRDPGGYNVVTLDGKLLEPSKLAAELRATPFLAEKRMVVVENILTSSDKELLQQLGALISEKKIPENTIAIFWQGEALSKVKEAKELDALLTKEKFAQEFAPLTGAKLTAWIQKEVAARGGTVAPDAVAFLAAHAGSDMWSLSANLDQLVAYTRNAGRPISMSDAQLFVSEKVDDNVFNLIEAMVSGNKKTALKLLDEQRRIGEEDGKLFGLFIWQFRILVEIADLLASEPHTTSDVIAKQLSIHPFVAKKNMAVARQYSLASLHRVYHKLLDIDIKTKTGQGDQSLLIDVFVSSLSA